MPYAQQTWTDNVTPVDAAHMSHIEAGIAAVEAEALPQPVVNGQWVKGVGGAAVWAPFATDALSATPPGSPVDGQLWLLPADAANGIVWQLRYNAGSASVYKWEFIGGSPMRAFVGTQENTTNTGASGLTTPGPSFTLPRAGEYEFQIGGFAYNLTAGFGAAMNLYINAANTGYSAAGGANYYNNVYRTVTAIATSPGYVAALFYNAMGGGTASFGDRLLMARPLRIS